MFERNHLEYYERRAAEATILGERADNQKIAALHFELALRYSILSFSADHGGQNVDAGIGQARIPAPEPFVDMADPALEIAGDMPLRSRG